MKNIVISSLFMFILAVNANEVIFISEVIKAAKAGDPKAAYFRKRQ